MKREIPFWEKSNLTIEEASALRELTSRPNCPYVLWIGRKCLIKKECLRSI